jgi:ribosomal protein S18 acetylase RimI-like enzyme
MVKMRRLVPDDWQQLRRIRLEALRDSPDAFASTLDAEEGLGVENWRDLLSRGTWLVALHEAEPIGIVAAVRECGQPARIRHVTSLWVAPSWRGRGVGGGLLRGLLKQLSDEGVEFVWLWVFDTNQAAQKLYRRLGFASTGERQSLPGRPRRTEERMRLKLPRPGRS